MIPVCRKCASPLKKGNLYCFKCGYNNETGAEEKLLRKEKTSKVSFNSIFTTLIVFILCCTSVYFLYQFASAHMEDMQKLISTVSKETLKITIGILGVTIIIESVLAYRTMDDSIFKTLFQYVLLYVGILFALIGYTYLSTGKNIFTTLPPIPILITLGTTGLFYFIVKWLASTITYKMKTGNYIIFFMMYSTFRIISWIIFGILFYFLLSIHIITL